MQLNPHFLFNAVNTISMMMRTGRLHEATTTLSRIAELFRTSVLKAGSQTTLLSEEIIFCKQYLDIEAIRFSDRLSINFHLDPTTDHFAVPSMILQPLIENAFKHGVNSEQKSRIRIEITMNQQELQLRVVNNKVNVQQDISERSGMGIENTKHRLNLVYPSNHLLVISDNEKEFFVSLYINLQ